MKLVEKRCPHCKGELQFDVNSKEVVCPFCRTKFEIDRTDDKCYGDNPDSFDLNSINVSKSIKILIIVALIILSIPIIVFMFKNGQ